MGLGPNISSESTYYIKGNPDPLNFKILNMVTFRNCTVAIVNYPDCINYEGNKILVLKSDSYICLSKEKLDPHFCKDSNLIARFVPTYEGYCMSLEFCERLSGVRLSYKAMINFKNEWHTLGLDK